VEPLLASRRSREWKASSEDEADFIDENKVSYFVSEENIILDNMKRKQGTDKARICPDQNIPSLRESVTRFVSSNDR